MKHCLQSDSGPRIYPVAVLHLPGIVSTSRQAKSLFWSSEVSGTGFSCTYILCRSWLSSIRPLLHARESHTFIDLTHALSASHSASPKPRVWISVPMTMCTRSDSVSVQLIYVPSEARWEALLLRVCARFFSVTLIK